MDAVRWVKQDLTAVILAACIEITKKIIVTSLLVNSQPSSNREGAKREDQPMLKCVRRFIDDETGATAIEYGLIAAIVSVGLISALTSLKTNLQNTYNTIGNAVANAN
jgi:pilus assembly protein Flp/PilA